ncbi:MAG: transglycosylase domain-containing protein [Alphaproteobacteria bacterium]|nr:transglycosylase domain-containing protein [Alphaproteobacteria bacterium]
MKRRALAALALLLVAGIGGGVLLERQALHALGDAGVVWSRLDRGLTTRRFEDVRFGPLRAEAVRWTLAEPRTVTVLAPVLDLEEVSRGGGSSGGSGGGSRLAGWSVALVGLQIRLGSRVLAEGLSGTVRDGEGTLAGPTATLVLPGPDGARAELTATLDSPVEQLSGAVELRLLASDPPQASLRAEALTLRERRLSPRPLRLEDVKFIVDSFDEDEIVAQASVSGLAFTVSRSCAQRPCTVTLTVPPDTPAADALAPLAPLIPELADATVEGHLGGQLVAVPETGALYPTLAIEGLAVRGAIEGLDQLRRGPFTYKAADEQGAERLRTTGEGVPGWTPLSAISPWLIAAVIAAEDSAFYTHPGYDLDAMAQAVAANVEAGAVVRGGSTLTQQLAKNLFLDDSRTFQRKLRELVLAVELDAALGKERVLALYLNVVEWGPGIWGIEAAAERYFLKKPATLQPNEAAFLAAILPDPRGYYRRWYLRGRASEVRVDWILNNMADGGALTRVEAAAWSRRPLRFVPPPVEAPDPYPVRNDIRLPLGGPSADQK